MNIPAASGQVCPGIGIHIMDIVHPPGISIPPFIDRQNQRVARALPAKIAPATV
jgi:hypothetical protein